MFLSQWLVSCEFPELLLAWFLSQFSFWIFDRISEIDRSSAAFLFLILISFMNYINFPCLWSCLPTRFLSLPAERTLCSTVEATRQHSLGCECESAVMLAALPLPVYAGTSSGRAAAGRLATLLRLSQLRAWGIPARGAGWTAGAWRRTAHAAADEIIWSLQTDRSRHARPRHCQSRQESAQWAVTTWHHDSEGLSLTVLLDLD